MERPENNFKNFLNFQPKFSEYNRRIEILSRFGFFALIFLFIIFISLYSNYFASAATSPDALAIRVIPNSDHYSPLHWYQKQGFTGSPQSLIVDGYEAVRDGRTVYVNAANIDTAANKLYTNTYLISYNQDAESATVDIFGRILEHWKFNSNIMPNAGSCVNNSQTASCDGTLGCWHFDGDFKDGSGNGNDGTESGGGITFDNGISGFAAKLDGIDDMIDYGKNPVLFPNSYFTISAWVKLEQLPNGESDIIQLIEVQPKVFMRINASNKPYVAIDNGPISYISAASPNNLAVGKWYYLVGVYDGKNLKIYVNGSEGSAVPNSGNLNWIKYGAIQVGGATSGSAGIKGSFDEIKIYNHALSAEDILAEYNKFYRACLLDSGCSSGGYCTSEKARIVRDTRRLSQIAEIKIAIEDYQNKQGFYPKLDAGTYLPHQSISVWPSWKETLSRELNYTLPFDPINKLGACAGFDPTTCWDEKTKKFSGSLPSNLPAGSNVIVYNSKDNGLNYDICAVMESGYLTELAQGACSQSYVNLFGQPGANNPPVIVKANIPKAYKGYPLCCFIEVRDPDNDKLVWTIDTTPGNPWTGWSGAPTLGDSGVPYQKAISAASVGNSGAYQFTITVDDGRGGVVAQTYTIEVSSSGPPSITSAPAPSSFVIGKNITALLITALDPDNQYPLSFTLTGLPKGLTGSLINKHDYSIGGIPIDQTMTYNVNATVADSGGQSSGPQSFQITITNNSPVITSSPVTNAYLCADYKYQAAASDPDGHELSYSATGLPQGLSIDSKAGLVSGQPSSNGTFTVTITAEDQYASETIAPYSAQAQQNYTLTVGNEIFSVNPIKNSSIFVFPSSVKMTSLYRSPVTYFGKAAVTTSSPVTYSLTNNPIWLVIDPAKGYIQGTPANNATDPGTYTITVNAATKCGVTQSTTFTLTVYPNEWCGDSITQASFGEACDDGNNIDTDLCSNTCKAQKTFCGDGAVQTPNTYGFNEQCEAPGTGTSNNDQYDCKEDCTWTGGWCGDSAIQSNFNEQCDNGVNNGNACAPSYNSFCFYCSSLCQNVTLIGPFCGDGTKNGSEQCDTLDGIASSPADSSVSKQYSCSPACTATSGWCGNGTVQVAYGEQCEAPGGGTSSTDQYGCTSCAWTGGWCGDGIVNGSEQCDDTNSNNNDSCVNCRNAYCGDGYVWVGSAEDCDDGNSSNKDSCTNSCYNSQYWSWTCSGSGCFSCPFGQRVNWGWWWWSQEGGESASCWASGNTSVCCTGNDCGDGGGVEITAWMDCQ